MYIDLGNIFDLMAALSAMPKDKPNFIRLLLRRRFEHVYNAALSSYRSAHHNCLHLIQAHYAYIDKFDCSCENVSFNLPDMPSFCAYSESKHLTKFYTKQKYVIDANRLWIIHHPENKIGDVTICHCKIVHLHHQLCRRKALTWLKNNAESNGLLSGSATMRLIGMYSSVTSCDRFLMKLCLVFLWYLVFFA